MRMPTKREWALLALLLALVVLATGSAEREADGSAEIAGAAPVERTKPPAQGTLDAGRLDLAQLRREAIAEEPVDAFESKSWYVPPPAPPPRPAPQARPAPVPTAPPLPFTYLGRFQDAASTVIFLVRGDRLLAVSEGDVIEGTYRIDGIAGATLGFTYLPLNIKQTLSIGSAG